MQFGFLFGGGARRRRRQPERDGAVPRLDRRLRRLVPAHAGAVALPRVRRRPRRGADHRPPERARLGADADLERHAPHPAARPAREPGAERLLLLPARGRQVDRRPVRDAPADGEADRGAPAPGDAAPGHAPDGPVRHPHGQAQGQAAGREPAVRDVDRRGHARACRSSCKSSGKAAIVFQPLATADFTSIVDRHGGGPARHRRGHRHRGRADRRRVRLPLDGPRRRGLRGPRRRRQRRLAGAAGRRLRRADPVRGVRVPRRAGPARLLDLQLQARLLLPVRARRRRPAAATPSASCGSRPRSATSSPSSRSSSAGSRSGASRSSRAALSRGSARRR